MQKSGGDAKLTGQILSGCMANKHELTLLSDVVARSSILVVISTAKELAKYRVVTGGALLAIHATCMQRHRHDARLFHTLWFDMPSRKIVSQNLYESLFRFLEVFRSGWQMRVRRPTRM
jgi:hypothetical protein